MKTAIKLGSFFKRDKRDNGETFVTLTDDRPEWLLDAVHAAHGDLLPHDWVYATCESACDAIDDGVIDVDSRDVSDGIHEHTDSQVDVYTRALYQWQADLCLSGLYAEAEERAIGLGANEAKGDRRVALIQYCAIESIINVIVEAWKEAREESEAEESDDDTEESEGPSSQA